MLHGSKTNPVQMLKVKVLCARESLPCAEWESRTQEIWLKVFFVRVERISDNLLSTGAALENIMQQLSQEMFSRRIGVAGGGGGASAMNQQRQEVTSGHETPVHFATEDTPAIFSRNDSLSSLSCNEESTETPSKGT